MEEELQALLRALVKRKQRSALVVGPPGTGKTALVRELAKRLLEGHSSIPTRLRDYDIFELSSTFLKAGTSLVGQYEERLGTLLKTLAENPKVVVFVDEVHSLLQSGMHERGNFSEANEAFKKALSLGELSLIGATTTAEFRHYLEPDQALIQRFSLIRIEPPTPEETLTIVQGRLPELEGYYDLDIPEKILQRSVELTEEYLPARAQPRKSIHFLDEACAYCVTRTPPLDTVTEKALWEALEDTIGHSVLRGKALSQDELFKRLSGKIVGQDEALRGITRAFVAGMGGWVSEREAPRGVLFFGGPTGVGKTETALLLAKEMGGGRGSMVRVDCNTLQPSGNDSGHALNVLLGPPPGYVGFVRGEGGVLSRIREHPESIVLFDEIEKADPGVGKLLLQILDSGRCEDNDGNILDFRRSYIVFTTNAGAIYDAPKHIGFDETTAVVNPAVDEGRMKQEIRKMGLGEEFLGRISHFFFFKGLEADAVSTILETQLEKLQNLAEVRGYKLEWDDSVLGHLVGQWQPRFGVRHLLAILRNRIVEHLSVADAQGELEGVTRIRLELMDRAQREKASHMTGMAVREKKGDTLVIGLG
jgi:ATP-dependent Clp protease ATP-binding subunit ClpA